MTKKWLLILLSVVSNGAVQTMHAGLSRAATAAVFKSVGNISLVTKNVLYVFGQTPLKNSTVDAGCASLQNLRDGGERAAYPTQDGAAIGALKGNLFVGVFDGHGDNGDGISGLVKKELVRRVLLSKEPARALGVALADMQQMLIQSKHAQRSGSTVVATVMQADKKLSVAHVGDSRLVVVRRGKVLYATVDHTPADLEERKRICEQGGQVIAGRACDPISHYSFALSRSLGDVVAQGKALSAQPTLADITVQSGDTIVLATDGLFDVIANEELAAFITPNVSAQEIADALVAEARARKSFDDITAFVLRIL